MIKKLLFLTRLFFSKHNTIKTELFGNNAKWLCFTMFLLANFSFGQSQTFTSSGTFNVPAGVTSVTVQVWGGGGAGGGANNANETRNGGGGGGGAYTIRTVAVTPSSSITVTVGSGGLGVTASDSGTNTGNGNDGGTSTFASAVPVVAAGGKGGKVGNSSDDNGDGGVGGVGGTYNGGNGQNSSGSATGGGGGSAGTAANGNTGTFAGVAAVTGGGAGAAGRNNNGPGISATTLGGGGGGGRMSNSADVKGGDGFRGQVIVTWTTCSTFSLTGPNTATAACTSPGTSTVTLVSNTTALPAGTYTVTYNTSVPSQTGLTATMNVTGGTGTFTATGLTSAGTRTITITQLVSNSCTSTISSNNTANVTVNSQPTAANAGPDQSTGSGSFTLAANTPTIGTGVWSIANGPSTLLSQFSSTSSPTATFSPAVSGTYVLNWAISNSCGTFNDQVVVANNCVTNMVNNSDFSGGSAGWTFATTYGDRIETNPENTYFSNGSSSITAELDSEASLRQVVTVIPGVSYTVSFRYARRDNSITPATTGVTVKVTGGATDFTSIGFTTTSTTSQIGTYTFTPTSSSIGLEFYNTLHGNETLGTIIDDIVLVPTSQVSPTATTSPKGVYNTLTSCGGVAVQLDVENVPASGITYAWTGPVGAVFSSTTIKNPTVTFTGSGVQQVSVTTTTAAGCSGSSITYVNVTAAPTITAPAASSVCSGSTYSSGVITSTGTTFSWSRAAVPNINGGAAGTGGTGIANATGFTEVLTNSTASPINVTYVLTPGPPSSGCAGVPYNLVVTVNPTVGITITLPTASSVCSGSTYSSGAITSSGTTFDWSRAAVPNINGGAAGAGGTNIAKATGFSEVLTNSTSSAITVTYVLTPKSASGCSGTPYNLVITVNPTAGITITAPTATSVCSGNTYSSGTITSSGTTFDWSRAAVPNINGGAAGAGGTGIAKATGFSETLTNSTSSAINVTYVLTPKSASGCSGTPYNLVITVNPTAGITITAPTASSVCSGRSYTSGAITSTGTTFDWSRAAVANINGGAAGIGGTNIVKATGFSETLTNSTSSAINVTYILTPKSALGCSGTPYNLVVTVNPAPAAPSASAFQTFCAASSPTVANLTATGTGIKWYDASSGGNELAGTTALISGNHYYASQTSGCESTTRLDVTALLNATPVITPNKVDESCPSSNNGSISPTFSGGLANVRYIRLTQKFDDPDGWLQVAEVNAFEIFTGQNVALSSNGASAVASSVYLNNTAANGPSLAIDGNSGTIYHSNTPNTNEYLEISLASPKNIDYLQIYNRNDYFGFRGQNILLQLLDNSHNVVYAKTVDLRGGGTNVIDVNVLDVTWSDAATTLNRTGLDSGSYTLNYADAAGCSASAPISITSINNIPAITAISSSSALCSGGSLNPSAPTVTANGSAVTASGWQLETAVGGGSYSNLTVPYTVSFADNGKRIRYYAVNGCGTTNSNSVSITVNETPAVPTVVAITHISCTTNTGSVELGDLPSGNWTINQTGDATGSYGNTIPNTTSTTISGLSVGSYTFTVTNASGCPSAVSATVTILDNFNTWNGSSWSRGIPPNASMNVIIDAVTPNSPFTADLVGCALTINSGVVATVPSGITLTITNEVTVNGSLTFENNSSLVQINDVNNNVGPIIYKRTTQPMKRYDFTYWSSPVEGQTMYNLSPNTRWDKYLSYTGDRWNEEPSSSVMQPGIGYIIRVPEPNVTYPNGESWSTSSYVQNLEFIGRPNNGTITSSQYMEKDKYYLIGNPYPSAMFADAFLYGNVHNRAILGGTVYFWTHNTAIKLVNSKYAYVSDDYASYNLTGGVGTSASTDSGHNDNPGLDAGKKPTGYIAAGQSFFTSADDGSGYVEFTNSMRYGGTNNTQFFKPGKTSKSAAIEKHRLWLNMTNTGGAFKQTLIGYIEGATNTYDKSFDGLTYDGNSYIDFYSINETSNLTIQGRALPFVDTDVVPLGYRSTIAGSFTIAIDQADGSLAAQRIYLEDRQTNTINELTSKNYTFTTKAGTFNNRFVLRYSNKTLATGDFETTDDAVWVVIQNKTVSVNSTTENIEKVFIYDVSGKQLYKKDDVKNLDLVIENLPFAQQVLLVKVVLENGYQTTKKVIFK